MNDRRVAPTLNKARELILWHLQNGAAINAAPEGKQYLIEWWYDDEPELSEV